MNKEETMFKKRLIDLSSMADRRDIVVFSDFLNMNELHILHVTPKSELSCAYETFGGYEYAERQMVAFLPDALSYEYTYPIKAVTIKPESLKYAEKLTHRDYLGSVLSLGIDRCKIGDLIVEDDKCILLCHENMSTFIAENLTRIRHTNVVAEITDITDFHYETKRIETQVNVASVRLDAVLSAAYGIPRSKFVSLIEGGKVFVNGKLAAKGGYTLKEQDIISVRGMGRIQYDQVLSQTRKGRYLLRIYKY